MNINRIDDNSGIENYVLLTEKYDTVQVIWSVFDAQQIQNHKFYVSFSCILSLLRDIADSVSIIQHVIIKLSKLCHI